MLPALRDGLNAKDAETKSRCKGLISRIEDVEWKRKVDAYSADVDGKKKHDLPLLKAYEKLVGTSPSARKLFAECLRTNAMLLQTAAGERDPALKAYRQRCAELERPLRIARLRAQIERDDRIAWEHTVPYAIHAKPGLVIHRVYGVGFPALGRKRKAERLLRHLEGAALATGAPA